MQCCCVLLSLLYMSQINKQLLLQGNAAIARGDHEAFLDLCTHDIQWEFVGEQTLNGKQAVSDYMAANYQTPLYSMYRNSLLKMIG